MSNVQSRSHCIVGCKLPNGLLAELGQRGDSRYQAVRLNGTNTARVIGGYGLTEGVPTDFITEWLNKHQDLDFVKKGLVFIHGDNASAEAQAKEMSAVKNGLEPLDPMKPGRGVEADLDHLKRLKRGN